MSILIRDMEMPKGNDELRLIIHSNGQVIISHQTYYEEAEAVSISPHGRLIDADDIEHITVKHEYIPINDWWVLKSIDAPTIIEAESEHNG